MVRKRGRKWRRLEGNDRKEEKGTSTISGRISRTRRSKRDRATLAETRERIPILSLEARGRKGWDGDWGAESWRRKGGEINKGNCGAGNESFQEHSAEHADISRRNQNQSLVGKTEEVHEEGSEGGKRGDTRTMRGKRKGGKATKGQGQY